MAGLSFRDEQQNLLGALEESVKKNAYYMRRALDGDNMREALRHSAQMLAELRTGDLYPQKYFELYMQVFDQLRHLEAYFGEEQTKGRKLADLYEMVQNAGQVLPRLYLMCTVGSVYMRSQPEQVPELLNDLVEMCKGVQHPTRGLFLRSYLCQIARPVLPDSADDQTTTEAASPDDVASPSKSDSKPASESKTTTPTLPLDGDHAVGTKPTSAEPDDAEESKEDSKAAEEDSQATELQSAASKPPQSGTFMSIDFLLRNFTEMNKLWVRMQHQGSLRDKVKREKERQQLSDLVGKNLTTISQLDGLNFELYKKQVQPCVLDQVVSCRDCIAQQYLMQCIIQCFPDEFHLGTLDSLLHACPELQPGVAVGAILTSFMDRLRGFAATSADHHRRCIDAGAFTKIRDALGKVAAQHTNLAAGEVIEMYTALMALTVVLYPDDKVQVNAVLAACCAALESRGTIADAAGEEQLVAFLSEPLQKYSVVDVLPLDNYPKLMRLLQHEKRLELSVNIVKTLLEKRTYVRNVEAVEMLFDFISPLVCDDSNAASNDAATDDADFVEQQNCVARLIHLLEAEELDAQLGVLQAVYKRLEAGGPRRWRHTLLPLSFAALKHVRALNRRGGDNKAEMKRVYDFVLQICECLEDVDALIALRIVLSCAHSASEEAHDAEYAEAMIEQACLLLDERIGEQRQAATALYGVIGVLHACRCFDADARERLVSAVARQCAKLIKKSDQCAAICACSHLYWQEPADGREGVRDGENVKSLLSRATRLATQAAKAVLRSKSDTNPMALFVTILNAQLYYLDKGADIISQSQVANLMQLIENERPLQDAHIESFYQNTLNHIRAQKTRSDAVGERYAQLQV